MDRDGIPLAFCMNPGNQNEQLSLIPLEKTLMEKFDMSQFIVCTDAGLSSHTNRYFNHYDKEDGTRDFITTQSVKKLKQHLKKWALDPAGWRLAGNSGHTLYKGRSASLPISLPALSRLSSTGILKRSWTINITVTRS